MLQAIRDKTSGWVATIVLGLIIVTMMFFGVESYMQRRPDDYLARVEGPRKAYGLLAGQVKDINQQEFRERFDRLRANERQSKGKDFDAGAFESPANKRKVLEEMIDEALLALAAERAGIVAPNAAVMRQIAREPGFQGTDGKFDKNMYVLRLQSMGLTAQRYETLVRDDLVTSLLPNELAATEFAGNAELESYLKLSRQTRDVRFLEVPPPAPPVAPPAESEVQAWYDSHKTQYRSPESVAVEYVEIDGNTMQVDTVADEETLHKRYQDTKQKYGTADQRLASHILVALPEKASAAQDAAALAKAKDLAAKARQPGADFAALAAASSDDVGSKDAGGDLGPVEKGVFGDAFDAAFAKLEPGQVSDPVKLPDGYHVLWFRELVKGDAKPFEEVRAELEAEYLQEERDRKFNDLTGKLIDRIYDDQSAALVPAAQEMKLPVQRTGLFTREAGDGVAALEQVRKAAFAEPQKNDRLVSDMVELEPNHVIVLHVTDVKASAQLPLATVRERVLADLLTDRAAKAAKTRAESVLARANKGENLEAIATELGRPVSNVPGITRQAPNPQLAPLVDAAFRLGRPVAGKAEFALAKLDAEHYALVGVTAVKEGDLTGLDDATRANLRKQLAAARGAVEARAYIAALRSQYTVKVAEDRL
jgi:peptidyl-prolyl cis-trans isomerase D